MSGVWTHVARYRSFLTEPGTLVTLASAALLALATLTDPAGFVGASANASPLYLAAALIGSVYIWYSAAQGIREGDFTADIPVSLATAAALTIGQAPAAAVVAVLLLVGGRLEDFVAARAGRALDSLARLLPDNVTIRRDGREVGISLTELRVDDRLLVRSGERIAVDGQVQFGSASVNQAAITGESLPIDKAVGDEVFAGTLCEVGAIEVRAGRVGAETTLGQIRRMVAEARAEKAPIERLLDRYAKLYTPAALLLGAALWYFTGDVLRAITVLIVFCPCVMVLATPAALVASIGNAALRGSLVKKGATVEALATIDTLAFDKTGTLTLGAHRLIDVVSLDGVAAGDLLWLAASAERFSEHPIGRSIVEEAVNRGLTLGQPEEFAALSGLGVSARLGDQQVLLGRPEMLADYGVLLQPIAAERATELAEGGRTVIGIALAAASGPLGTAGDSRALATGVGEPASLRGLLVLEDQIRPQARAALARLHKLGLRTVLISGDSRVVAERVARELGIDEVHAEVLPSRKVEIIRDLQARGRRVAFVGDGVNDGPALAAADVGIAMGLAGTDVAVETAEIALLADDLGRLPHLLSLSRRAVGAIHQNLAFSLVVLAVAVGLTIVGILTPVTGALLHELSSLPVIANSARLIGLRDEA